jgi:uncharacterized protein YqjF (DUF2071 family)
MHPALERVEHRPWPLPDSPWIMRQQWRDLLFAHWRIAAEALRPLVPRPLSIQEFDGSSWVGLVPFRMTGVMVRPLPDLPYVSAFPELNLRLYVELDGKPGVWFVSLDAANWLAVHAARRLFHLPYFHAAMSCEADGERIRYRSQRKRGDVVFAGRYEPISEVYESRPGTLEHFLTERYCLYAARRDGTLLRAEVHHRPWPLQRARLDIEENRVAGPQGIAIAGPPALLHFSRFLDVVVWTPHQVEAR